MPKRYLALGACVLVIAIALSVFLPLYLTKGNDSSAPLSPELPFAPTNPEEPTYSESSGWSHTQVSGIEEIEEALGHKVIYMDLTEVEGVFSFMEILHNFDGNRLEGAQIAYTIFGKAIDEMLDTIECYIFFKGVDFGDLYFRDFDKERDICGVTVHSKLVVVDLGDGFYDYIYYAYFTDGYLEYYVTVKAIDEIDIEAIWDAFFEQ